jgi:hypothetical protein
MTALFVALAIVVLIGLSGTAAADIRNLTSSADTQLTENSPAANYGGATSLKVDGDDPGGSGKDASSLLRWDLSSVPAGSKVDSASVTVNVTNPSSQTYQIYDLERPWVESAATWLQYASGSAWQAAGAKGSLDRGSQVGSISAPSTGKQTFTLSPALVQRWLDNPASNQGIIIANATNTDGIDFSSRQDADASLRPTLSMNYSGTTTPPPSTSRYLSDMNWTSATNGWGPAEKDMSNGEQAAGDGHTIILDGATFQNGLGVHAASDVRYSLAGAYSTFSAKVGVDDEVGDRGSVVFEVWADGTRLYSSGVMNGASTTKDVKLNISGKNELRLVVTNASDGADFDHADWAGAMVDNSSPPPPDTDGDGVTDDVDKCINEAGPASNNGCPVVESPPSSSGDAVVFAHWHHDAQRAVSGANTLSAYTQEIQKAKAMGVDAFAVNTVNWQSAQQSEIGTLYDAAEQYNAAHPDNKFFLFPSADQCCSMSESTLDSYMTFRYNSPARLRVDGGRYGNNLPVAQTWHGESKGASEWKRIQNEWAASGKPMYFIPYFDKGPYSGSYSQLVDAYNGSNNSDPSDDAVDGLYNFGGIASGNNSEAGLQSNAGLDSAVDASPGMDAMAGCAPHFNRHSDNGQFGNRIIGDFEGYHAWLSCLQGLQTQKPRFVEFVTWSDYLEGSYLGGPYTNSQLWPTYRGNNLSHDAFRKLGAYYDEWFHTGTKPAISKDLIAIAHRLHPEDAPGINLNGAGILDDTDSTLLVRQTDYSVVEDRLYAAVMLTQPGQVRLTSGTSSQTFDVPAGVTEVSMPFAPGTQKIDLLRGGNVVLTATSARQVVSGPVDLFNYNVETTYAEGP